jgi:hypothetical protein
MCSSAPIPVLNAKQANVEVIEETYMEVDLEVGDDLRANGILPVELMESEREDEQKHIPKTRIQANCLIHV